MSVNISATFSKDQKPLNGLATDRMVALLSDEAKLHDSYIVVARVRPHVIKTAAEDGTRTPTVRFDHIEPLEGDQAAAAVELLNAAYTERTGREPQMELDFDLDGDEGEREVPEASGEELLAEHEEQKAARGGRGR